MKIRLGFVSNSSSSSFTCEVCKENISGMDMGLFDAGMYECVNGHTFCEDHFVDKLNVETKRKIILEDKEYIKDEKHKIRIEKADNDSLDEAWENYEDECEFRYNVPENFCPICQFINVCEVEGFYYLLEKNKMSVKDFLSEIKTKFKDYKGLQKYINKLYKHED